MKVASPLRWWRRNRMGYLEWPSWACSALNVLDIRYWFCECHYAPPYGFVVMAGCERHDERETSSPGLGAGVMYRLFLLMAQEEGLLPEALKELGIG